jgi:hypothetical protein
MNAIGEKNQKRLRSWIHPDQGAGESRVPERGPGREPASAGAGERGIDVPPKATAIRTAGLHAGHLPDGLGSQHLASAHASVREEHAAVAGQVGGGGEESGVAGDAVHRAGGGVVHHSVQEALRQALGGRAPLPALFGRVESGIRHSDRSEDLAVGIDVESVAGDHPHELSEHDEIDVAVDERESGRASQPLAAGQVHPGFITRPGGFEIHIGPEAGHVGQELAHGDGVLAMKSERREVAGHRRVELQQSALNELHHRGRGGDHLGQRRSIVHGVDPGLLPPGLDRARAIRFSIHWPSCSSQSTPPGRRPSVTAVSMASSIARRRSRLKAGAAPA